MLQGEPRQEQVGDSHLSPPGAGCFGAGQPAEQLMKDPGLGSDLSTR